MIKVSVIIAIYNVAPYLKRSLECLLNQTLKEIEIICIDDCSTDNSLEIIREYAEKDNRIKIIESERNNGAAVARNKGLEIAEGEYLGFVDPDDEIDLNYYEELYKTAKENKVDVVKCGRKNIYPNGKVEIGMVNHWIREFKTPYVFSHEWTTAIYRREFINKNNIKFPEECPKAQDVVFLARVMFKHATLKVIDSVYYYYYKRDNSLNSEKIPIKNIKSALKAIELMIKEVNNSGLDKTDPKLYVTIFIRKLSVIFYTLFQNDSKEAKTLCAEALIEYYHRCINMEELGKEFPYRWMIKEIENRDVKKLTKILSGYKSEEDIKKPLKWYQKLLSVKNGESKRYGKCKVIYIIGIKIEIKTK